MHPADDPRPMLERMRSGDLYLAEDPEIERRARAAHRLTAEYNATDPADRVTQAQLLARLLGSIGEDTVIRPPFFVDFGTHLHLGARCFANFGLTALDVAEIRIGDDVQIGPHVQLLTPTHPLDAGLRRDKWEAAAPITIGDNVWLGGGVVVLPGVTIGPDTVVGAGAVVTRDLPAGVLTVGNPARVLRRLDAAPTGLA